MVEFSQHSRFFMNYAMVHTSIFKKIDNQLSIHGINFSEFMIMFHLVHAPEKKMRRIDLADKIGLSASGITRLVAPMEKRGLVYKESNKRDARVSLVKLSAAGERILKESGVSLDITAQGLLSGLKDFNMAEMLNTLKQLGGNIE
ncbi:MAG: winged helix-turn-helix transcriptional regulator [Deltaproteobacteria bacterium]|jgi:DNA-binding MarR family transcriptional regulator|nr:winged helix-turn-helix transcriptional regulator [Deltaproteobacteria bacterium]MBT4525143.1 winged helix-turn-helix transcriptional regulator [Deltaproteobacteria bacterium]